MKITQNMGTADKIVRFLIAGTIISLYFTGLLNGVTAAILLSASAVFILTGMVSFCPLYLPFNISTKRKQE